MRKLDLDKGMAVPCDRLAVMIYKSGTRTTSAKQPSHEPNNDNFSSEFRLILWFRVWRSAYTRLFSDSEVHDSHLSSIRIILFVSTLAWGSYLQLLRSALLYVIGYSKYIGWPFVFSFTGV